MPVVATPDLGAAIMLHLRACAELVSAISNNDRIFLEWPKGLVVPTPEGKFINCILIETGKGGPGDIGLALIDERVTIKCYGANRKTANDIYRIMHSYLMRLDERTVTSFKRANCSVRIVFSESTGLRLNDPTAANWDFVEAAYIFRYSAIPI